MIRETQLHATVSAEPKGSHPARAAWIDVMGAEPCYIDAEYDYDQRRVLVSADTLATMAEAVRTAGIFSEDDASAYAADVLAAPMVDGRHDVTELGGSGWTHWQDVIVDDDPRGYAPAGYYDPIEVAPGEVIDHDDPRPWAR